MSKRERILASAILLLAVLVGLQMMISRIRSGMQKKEDQIEALNNEIEKKNDIIFNGELAVQAIERVVPRSLPSNTQLATADYRVWLDKVVKQVGFENAKYEHLSDQQEKGVYVDHKFKLDGVGTIKQLVEFLYRFHEKDSLHRIQSVVIGVPNESYKMKLTITIEAIGLVAASPNQAPLANASLRLSRPLEDYQKMVLERNLFSPENKAPVIAKSQTTQIAKDDQLEFDPGAKDPDGHGFEFAFVGSAPEGMKIDKSTGKIVWRPKELGDYEVLVAVNDNGIPSRRAEQKLAIKVVEPPPPPAPVKEEPKFDVASQAFITGLLAGGKQPEVWVQSRTEGKTHFLKVGDNLKLGSVEGKVVAIGATYAELETEGKRWIVGQDESLADAYRRKDVD